jgi:iron complex outermembrane receptor protein
MVTRFSFVVLALAAATAASAQEANQADDLKLEEVVVTAERREANLQDVPLAVSAFTPEDNGTSASLFDVERVEVLRGPQGTLYGRNTTGGAIRVITAKPTGEFSATAEASLGSFSRWHLKGAVNLPASEQLFFRLNGFIEQGDGWADNLFDGSEVNDNDGVGARIAARWVPSAGFTGDLSIDYYKSDQAGLYGSDIGGIVRARTSDTRTVVSGTDTSNVGRTYGAALTLNWQFGDSLELQSITGFRNVYQKWNLDLSDQPQSIFLLYTINARTRSRRSLS